MTERTAVENMSAKQNRAWFRFVDEDTFEQEVTQSIKPVLAVFWASWSHPCQMIDSVLADVATTCAESVTLVKVNADDNPHLCLRYDLSFIPTLLLFVAGDLRETMVGTASKEAILRLLRRHGHADSVQPADEKVTTRLKERTFA